MGPDKIIGISAVFPTESKKDVNKTVGLAGIREIKENIKIPKIAIGGIKAANIKDVMLAGAAFFISFS